MLPTLANSATPLMHLTLLWVLVGNIVIGFVEGVLLARLLEAPRGRSIVTAIGANYASAWAGFLLILPAEARPTFVHRLFSEPISHPYLIVTLSLAVTFGLSVVVETLVMRLVSTRGWAGTLGGVTIANVASHLLLVPFFMGTTIRIGSDVRIVSASEFTAALPAATVYFLDDRDGSLASIALGGTNQARVPRALESLDARGVHDVLVVTVVPPDGAVSEANPPHLALTLTAKGRSETRLKELADRTASPFRSTLPLDFVTDGWWLGAGGIADLRPDRIDWRQPWPEARDEPQVHPSGNTGIRVGARLGRPILSLTFDTPFGSWFGRSVTRLNDDVAVFELGCQICLLSISERTLVPIARGRGPVVVLDEPAPPPSAE